MATHAARGRSTRSPTISPLGSNASTSTTTGAPTIQVRRHCPTPWLSWSPLTTARSATPLRSAVPEASRRQGRRREGRPGLDRGCPITTQPAVRSRRSNPWHRLDGPPDSATHDRRADRASEPASVQGSRGAVSHPANVAMRGARGVLGRCRFGRFRACCRGAGRRSRRDQGRDGPDGTASRSASSRNDSASARYLALICSSWCSMR